MKRLLSIITIIALISSMILPSFAASEYTVALSLSSSELSISEKLDLSGTLLKAGKAASDMLVNISVYNNGDIKDVYTEQTGVNGQFSISVPLNDFKLGSSKVVVGIANETLATEEFQVVDKEISKITLESSSVSQGESLVYSGVILIGGKPASDSDIKIITERNGNVIEVINDKSDASGKFNGSIKISADYPVGSYKIKASVNSATAQAAFTVKAAEIKLVSIDMASISNMWLNQELVPTVTAKYSDSSTKNISNDSSLVLTSSNPDVVKVVGNKISAVKAGNCKITATFGGMKSTIDVNVIGEISRSINISTDKEAYITGEKVSASITAVIQDQPVKDKNFKAELQKDGKTIMLVNDVFDGNGKANISFVIPKDKGTGVFVIKVFCEGFSSTKNITVSSSSTSIKSELSTDKGIYYVGDTIFISGTIRDENGKPIDSNAHIELIKDGNVLEIIDPDNLGSGNISAKINVIKSLKSGTYTIKLSDVNVSLTKTIEIRSAKVKKIKFHNNGKKNALVGENIAFKVSGEMTDGVVLELDAAKEVTFTFNPSNMFAKVSDGIYKAKVAGTCNITATYDGNVIDTIKFDVINPGGGSSGGSSSGGSSSSGGGGGGSVGGGGVPAGNDKNKPSDNIESKDITDGIANLPKEVNKDNKAEAVKAAKEVINKAKGSANGKDAKAIVEEINKAVNAMVKGLDAAEAAKLVEDTNALMDKVLDNQNVTPAEALKLVEDHIALNIKEIQSKGTNPVDTIKAMKQAEKLIEKAIAKSAKLLIIDDEQVALGSTIGKTQPKIIEINDANIETAINSSVYNKVKLEKLLNDNKLTSLSKNLGLAVDIEVNTSATNSDIVISKASAERLSTAKSDANIINDSVKFNIPSTLMSATSDKIVISMKNDADVEVKEYDLLKGGKVKPLKTFDFDFKKDGKSYKASTEEKLSITVDVEKLGIVTSEVQNLVVKVKAGNEWESVDFTYDNGKITFYPEHFSVYSIMTYSPTFDDISKHWGKANIEKLASMGIISGRNSKTFDPDGNITRAEFAKVLVELTGVTAIVDNNFADVSKDQWYYNYVGIAAQYGIVAGVKDGKFRPDEYITREDMAVMIAKTYEIMNGVKVQGTSEEFTDDKNISDYAKSSVYFTKYSSIINGYPDGTFKPKDSLTRAEAASVLLKLMD